MTCTYPWLMKRASLLWILSPPHARTEKVCNNNNLCKNLSFLYSTNSRNHTTKLLTNNPLPGNAQNLPEWPWFVLTHEWNAIEKFATPGTLQGRGICSRLMSLALSPTHPCQSGYKQQKIEGLGCSYLALTLHTCLTEAPSALGVGGLIAYLNVCLTFGQVTAVQMRCCCTTKEMRAFWDEDMRGQEPVTIFVERDGKVHLKRNLSSFEM